MKLRNIRLTLANVAKTPNSKIMEVIGTGIIRERLVDGTYSDKVIGYTLECSANKGDTLKVKFPANTKEKIEKITTLLQDDMLVEVSFVNLKLTPYAMLTKEGGVLSGVSAKADDFEYTVKEDEIFLDEIQL